MIGVKCILCDKAHIGCDRVPGALWTLCYPLATQHHYPHFNALLCNMRARNYIFWNLLDAANEKNLPSMKAEVLSLLV